MQAAVARTGTWKLQIVRRCDRHRFVVLPKSWIVERTLAWISHCGRLARLRASRPQSGRVCPPGHDPPHAPPSRPNLLISNRNFPEGSLSSLVSFALHPRWAVGYYTHERFELSQLKDFVKEGSDVAISVGEYFSTMLDQSMSWKDAEELRQAWSGQFCLKGIMSVADAKRAVAIGASGIMVSNHGGRQLDGSRSAFDQLSEIVDAVGDKIDVILDGGIRRGTHVVKALAAGAKACSGGRMYL